MTKLIEKDLVYKIVGCAMAVHNEIGHGFREKTYENALCVEFKHEGLEYAQQSVFPVMYRSEKVDRYIPDLIVENKIIVDTKTVESIIDEHRGTILNYLRVTNLQVGLIINYKHPKLEWERLVLDTAR
ncbi:GxxExxY protein [candidate division KSB1 bacterium]|nr:GxxExxY protein [candidate division KSB1 bacterium]MCH7753676.1 GxxExxY protein [candidate division KSB1 bacterium]